MAVPQDIVETEIQMCAFAWKYLDKISTILYLPSDKLVVFSMNICTFYIVNFEGTLMQYSDFLFIFSSLTIPASGLEEKLKFSLTQ